MIENDFNPTEQELETAGLEIREQWGAEVDEKLENLLEYQILNEAGGVESTQCQRVIIRYKSPQPFEDFHEEFEDIAETYEKRNEEFEFHEFDEFERLANEGIESLLEDLKKEEIQEHLILGEAVVANLTPARIKEIAARGNVERVEIDKPLKLELDQSAVTVGVVNARTEGLIGTGKGVIIAVLDGEVDTEHPDLKGRVVRKKNYTNEPWGKPHPHGTHVAGIIAGNGSQNQGKYKGMAPEAIIWSYKILPTEAGNGSEEGFKGADAIEDTIKDMKEGVKIANCSWGVPTELDGNNIWAKTAERAAKLGLVLVKSAGNNGRSGAVSLTSPADAKGDVIVVGASSHNGTTVMDFSSRGPTADNRPKPDILAPGDFIMSAIPGGGYRKMPGTSMAAPHIAGIAGLMLERYPKLEPWQIKKILMESAKPLDSENDPNVAGKGLVDVVKALKMAGQPLPEEKKISYTPAVKERKLLERLNIIVQNSGEETMQAIKASLVATNNGIKVTSPEQDYGNLRVGADATRHFEIIAPIDKPNQYDLTLNVNFTTPTGKKKTQSYKIPYKVPSLTK